MLVEQIVQRSVKAFRRVQQRHSPALLHALFDAHEILQKLRRAVVVWEFGPNHYCRACRVKQTLVEKQRQRRSRRVRSHDHQVPAIRVGAQVLPHQLRHRRQPRHQVVGHAQANCFHKRFCHHVEILRPAAKVALQSVKQHRQRQAVAHITHSAHSAHSTEAGTTTKARAKASTSTKARAKASTSTKARAKASASTKASTAHAVRRVCQRVASAVAVIVGPVTLSACTVARTVAHRAAGAELLNERVKLAQSPKVGLRLSGILCVLPLNHLVVC